MNNHLQEEKVLQTKILNDRDLTLFTFLVKSHLRTELKAMFNIESIEHFGMHKAIET